MIKLKVFSDSNIFQLEQDFNTWSDFGPNISILTIKEIMLNNHVVLLVYYDDSVKAYTQATNVQPSSIVLPKTNLKFKV